MPIKIRDGGAWKVVSDTAGGGEFFSGTTKVARIWDQKPSSDGAGTPDAYEAWRTRTLNQKEDPSSFVTLESGNQIFSLPSGSYRINWRASAHDGNKMRTRLRYDTVIGFSSPTDVLGESGISDTASSESNYYSCGSKTITITQRTYFVVQQYQDAGNWGQASQIGDHEIYTQVFIEDLATAVKDNVVGGTSKVAKLFDAKTKGTGGGTYANPSELGTWKNRTLNAKTDPKNFVTLDSGNVYFSVPAGSYEIKWDTPAYMLGSFQSRLQYDDNSSFSSPTSVLGSTEFASTNAGVQNAQLSSDGIAVVTVTEITYFKIQIQGSGTPGDANALGKPSDIDTEIYTQVSVEDLATAVQSNADYVAGVSKVATLQDQKSQGTNGGNFSNGSWQVRTLTAEIDPQAFVTFPVAGDLSPYHDWSLGAGSYKIRWSAPAFNVGVHQTRLAYDDNSSFSSPTYVYGSSENADNAGSGTFSNSQTRSVGEAIVTPSDATTWFRLEHRCQTTRAVDGMGEPANMGTEVYTEVSIIDLETAVKKDGQGGAIDGVFWENNMNVTQDYTVSAEKNAMAAGPLSINTGVTITVPTGSAFTIV